MQFYVICVKHGSTLNATILIILITIIYKVVTNHGIAFLVPQCSFHLVILTIKKFLGFVNNNNDNNNESKNSNSFLILKPPADLALLLNQFNNAIPENNIDPEDAIQSKYYDIDELQQLKIPNKEKSLSLFHINSCSLNKIFEELQNFCSQQMRMEKTLVLNSVATRKESNGSSVR